MRLRSLLFVPGDRPERMRKARGLGADALILDLEDAVAPERKSAAREDIAEFIATVRAELVEARAPGTRPLRPAGTAGRSGQASTSSGRTELKLFVRVNPLDSGLIEDDLAAVLAARPDGLVLPKAEGAASVTRLAALASGLLILPVATETPAAIFQLGSYGSVAAQLAGLTWGAEDLPAAIGATSSREADGGYTPPYQLARSLTLFGAHAAGVPAIETVYPDFRDLDGLAAYAARGRSDGFTGMMAIHPAQVPVINAAFTPSTQEVAHARQVVALFAANPGAGALQLDGRMVDAPHLKSAQALLALAAD